METLEASSIDFYVMLHSVVTQKRDAELTQAVAQSGWTTFSSPRPLETASWSPFQRPAPGGRRKAWIVIASAVQ